jgi:hypothetical protein
MQAMGASIHARNPPTFSKRPWTRSNTGQAFRQTCRSTLLRCCLSVYPIDSHRSRCPTGNVKVRYCLQ